MGNRQLEKEAAQAGGAAQVLTTSSMTGSGLAASSCSFTFSSTRGRKNTGLLGNSSTPEWTTQVVPGRRRGPLSRNSEDSLVSQVEADPRAQKGTEQALAGVDRPRPQATR